MKKIIHILLASLCCGFALSSCEYLLDKDPLASLSPDSFFSNESELQAFSNSFYTMFPATSLYEENADLYVLMSLPEEMRDGREPASEGGWSWGDLRKINTFLANINKCKDTEVRTRYEGLARFFRAYFYFAKVKRYGDVPWTDKELASADPEVSKPRDSREYVMQKILADIDFAIENLPATKSVYTVTKWTALALKSRICLFEGTFRKYHNVQIANANVASINDYTYYLQQCADASYEFMTTSGYSILTTGNPKKDYLSLFTSMNATETKGEVILARDYNKNYNVYHNSNYSKLVASMGRPGMNKKIVAGYLMKDGSRFTDKEGWETMTFVEETKNRDPRLAQSIRTPGYTRMGESTEVAPDLNCSITGYHPIKYVTTPNQDVYNGSDIDLILFRAAEVYLNYAEAKAELGTLTQGDIDISIKQLRDRVGMPNLDMQAANKTPDPFLTDKAWGGYQHVTGANKGVILEIRRERTVELAQEGHRYYDIMRWREGKIFEQQLYGLYFPALGEYDINGDGTLDVCIYEGKNAPVTKASLVLKVDVDIILSNGTYGYVNPHKNNKAVWNEDRDYLYPIPTGERSLTNGALTQNPGWDDGLDF